MLPAVARTGAALGLTVYRSPQLLDVVDPRGGRGLDRLFQRLARELTAAETEARAGGHRPARGRRARSPPAC